MIMQRIRDISHRKKRARVLFYKHEPFFIGGYNFFFFFFFLDHCPPKYGHPPPPLAPSDNYMHDLKGLNVMKCQNDKESCRPSI